ncbi:MAG: flagellar filament capping protein FliD [Novosphingobium sp.]|nr:flagellar filament capping protein FliD [Novosphingobium sp.]
METSSTRSATQSLIASLGAGSGMDMAQFASDLAAAQFAPRIDRLTAKSETLDRQISAASNLKSMIFSLATSLGQRIREGDLSPQPRIVNGSVASASLSGSRQPSGSYSLEVTALASAQTLASPAYAAATDIVGSGTLTLRFGTVVGGTFTEDVVHAAVDVDIASGAILSDVAAAINGKNAGVSAYIAQTVAGPKLVLKGADGAANGFVLEATETVGEEGLANLAWSPGAAPERLLCQAGDAAFKVDGLEMASVSNHVVDAIPGVTLDLTATNTGTPTTVTFSDPSGTISSAMQDLTAALNEIAAEIKLTTDPKSGDLARDGGARALQRSFSQLAGTVIMPNAPEGAPNTLSALGLSTQRDGSFALDQARLTAALESDPEAVAAMFTTGLHGVYATIDNISRSSSKISDPGTLAGSINRYTETLQKVTEDHAELAEKQEALRARLAFRFTASESRIGAAKSTLSFLQNQIAAWNAQKS